jgi:hypothetical protein
LNFVWHARFWNESDEGNLKMLWRMQKNPSLRKLFGHVFAIPCLANARPRKPWSEKEVPMFNGILAKWQQKVGVGAIFSRTALAGAIILGSTIPTKSQDVDPRNFWFLNNTGSQVDRVYVSPHESGRWGRDVLGSEALPTGIGTVISFDPEVRTSCYYDFKLVFHDGHSQVYTQGRNLCVLHAVQFNYTTSEGL